MTIAFELAGQAFIALNGGPQFTFTPAISLFVSCETQEEVDELWTKLLAGGGKPDRVRVAGRQVRPVLADRPDGADRADERSRPEGVRTGGPGAHGHAEDRHRRASARACLARRAHQGDTNEVHADDEHARRRAVPDRQLARRGHRGAHRVHEELRQEALGCGRAGRGRGSERAGPGEARARRRRRRADHRRRVSRVEGVPRGLLDRGRRHAGARLRDRCGGIGGARARAASR